MLPISTLSPQQPAKQSHRQAGLSKFYRAINTGTVTPRITPPFPCRHAPPPPPPPRKRWWLHRSRRIRFSLHSRRWYWDIRFIEWIIDDAVVPSPAYVIAGLPSLPSAGIRRRLHNYVRLLKPHSHFRAYIISQPRCLRKSADARYIPLLLCFGAVSGMRHSTEIFLSRMLYIEFLM